MKPLMLNDRNIFNKIGVIEHEIIQTLIKFVKSCNFKWNSSVLVYFSYISLTQIVGTYSVHEIQTGSLMLLVCFCFSCVTCINTEKFPVDWVYFQ
jgi:formate hydrogenlyase subunit 4